MQKIFGQMLKSRKISFEMVSNGLWVPLFMFAMWYIFRFIKCCCFEKNIENVRTYHLFQRNHRHWYKLWYAKNSILKHLPAMTNKAHIHYASLDFGQFLLFARALIQKIIKNNIHCIVDNAFELRKIMQNCIQIIEKNIIHVKSALVY